MTNEREKRNRYYKHIVKCNKQILNRQFSEK